jgi:copper oxidase (laccase) domain-containing protein
MTKYSVNPESIYCYIGPGISVKHYEIGKDITKNFSGESLELRDDKIFLDLKKEIFGQLTDSEIPEINIEVSGYCTFERFDLFHSYRRDGNQSGRMMGVIGMI